MRVVDLKAPPPRRDHGVENSEEVRFKVRPPREVG